MSTTDSSRRQPSLTLLVVVFVGFPLVFLAFLKIRRLWEARHPAVSEHRDELVAAAVKAMKCGPDGLSVVAEEPTRARVEGCGRAATFRWSRRRSDPVPEHWHEIDPNCRVEYMGCNLPCD